MHKEGFMLKDALLMSYEMLKFGAQVLGIFFAGCLTIGAIASCFNAGWDRIGETRYGRENQAFIQGIMLLALIVWGVKQCFSL